MATNAFKLFTMVGENFGIYSSQLAKNIYKLCTMAWLEKSLKFPHHNLLKCTPHGWRWIKGISRDIFSYQGKQNFFKGFQGVIQGPVKFKGNSMVFKGSRAWWPPWYPWKLSLQCRERLYNLYFLIKADIKSLTTNGSCPRGTLFIYTSPNQQNIFRHVTTSFL